MDSYWSIIVDDVLTCAGIAYDPAKLDELAKSFERAASAESSYTPPVSTARIGPSDYERGFKDGRADALKEVSHNLGWKLELKNTRSGPLIDISDEASSYGYSRIKIE